MLSDIVNFVEGAARVIQETVRQNIAEDDEQKGRKKGKAAEQQGNHGASLQDQIDAMRSYFERSAAAQEEEEAGAEHLKFKTLLHFKEALGDREEELVHKGPVLYQGTLLKQGRRVNIWKERYFILKETGLTYYSTKPTDEQLIALTIQHTKPPGENDADLPKVRGNVFFADIMTVTGRVVDVLPMLQNPWLGGREHAFCLHTGASMYVLAASDEESKKKWVDQIEHVFSKFLDEQLRKVALMELSWELAADARAMDGGTKKATLRKQDKARRNIIKSTLERTQSMFVGKELQARQESSAQDALYGKTFREKRRKAEEALAVKRRVEHAQSAARGSINRINKNEHRRISKRSVNDMLNEMMERLESKLELSIRARHDELIMQHHFYAWRAFAKYQARKRKEGGKQLKVAESASDFFK